MADKRTRQARDSALAKAQKLETKVQVLAVAKTPEARKERMKLWENRNWLDRGQPNMKAGHGEAINTNGRKQLTARGKGKCGFTYKDYQ